MPTRDKPIGIRLTAEEHERLVEMAEKRHLKPASWARQVILDALDAGTSKLEVRRRPKRSSASRGKRR